jgi:type I restriction enzyme, S subunit
MELRVGYKRTDVGLIPEEWNVLPLSECAKRITDGEHLTPRRSSSGYYLLSARNILNGRVDLSDVDYVGEDEYRRIRQRCNPETGDVLISCSGTVGRVATVPPGLQCVMVRSAALIKPDLTKLSGLFIQYFLQSAAGQKQIVASLNQGAQANLFLNHIQTLRIPIPPTKAEQEGIAEALSDADALIESLEHLIVKKHLVKQGAMQELLAGKRRLAGFSGAKWQQRRLGELGESLIGLTYKPSNVKSDGLLVLRSSNSFREALRFEDNVFVDMDVPETIILRKGDILICVRNGSRDLIGKCALINEEAQGMTFGAFMAVFRTPFYNFVYHQFQSDLIKRQINEHLGATINQITNKSLNSFQIPFPTDERERAAITEILSDMDAEIVAAEGKLAKARQLKHGMMQELLTGRTRLV